MIFIFIPHKRVEVLQDSLQEILEKKRRKAALGRILQKHVIIGPPNTLVKIFEPGLLIGNLVEILELLTYSSRQGTIRTGQIHGSTL
ncbi:hypothetical protein [Desulfuromonas sp. AOP6]|uniref:hypothetical protein n=1 Tax=Desulfuromonas sp. AOP6 TaxID=1566351 RepID=UPI0012DE553A|nr:hypothetical protein [Desulfuromonas sp. AOP6]